MNNTFSPGGIISVKKKFYGKLSGLNAPLIREKKHGNSELENK